MKSKIITLTVLFLCSLNVFAQTLSEDVANESSTSVIELDAFLAPPSQSLRVAGPTSSVTLLNVRNVKELVYTTQPSIYYYGAEVKVYGDKPRNLFTDLNSLNNLNNSILLKDNIEIITINLENVSQLNNSINLNLLSGFKKLKYIYFSTSFDVTSENVSNMISGENEKYMIFYKVQKGDNNQ
ncbi:MULTISPECIES: hypothetical protein [unclassified Flavobacterium]|uniref:hypothetical protein n=1 Tax=unclassified Flavobacterium TaxID=196869 RepID=UPI000EABFF12|nr:MULTISPECIES: hypothetical protein [unclassified Flavobacterium]RKS02361.1 hypothetical protein C8C84_2071 [Flavobacterium sp. 102]